MWCDYPLASNPHQLYACTTSEIKKKKKKKGRRWSGRPKKLNAADERHIMLIFFDMGR